MAQSDNGNASNVDREALIRFKNNQVLHNQEVHDVIIKILEGMSDMEDRLRKLEGRRD